MRKGIHGKSSKNYRNPIGNGQKDSNRVPKYNGHKVTTERLSILETIYGTDMHFDAMELHYLMREKGYVISLATIYNNLSLYVEAGLINKHNLLGTMAQYERC
ncbi:MAG: transcriptional repressor [Bacteroidota bacterium]